MILGTAGHVDHGKTALVKALTGIDTDRLPEEKRRGITLELGFAHFALADGRSVSVIDMPGHERFVKAMAAGAGGIDLVLLVVAADEGVMPQTREHVDICSLLGVRAGLVVITKSDLLADLGGEWRTMLEADLRTLTMGTFLEKAPVLEVSAKTGLGLEGLRHEITHAIGALEAEHHPVDGPFFMPIDRAFSVKGFGCVVTGTVRSGRLAASDSVQLLPHSAHALRLRGLQVHGAPVGGLSAGQRAAVNIAGLETAEVHRGMALSRAFELTSATSLEVELTLLPTSEHGLARRSRQVVSLGTAHVEAVLQLLEADSLSPGSTGFAQLRLTKPVAALPGQRFIIRGTRAMTGRGTTLGGGTVLALNGKRRRRGGHSNLAAFAHGTLETRLTWLLSESGASGLTENELFARASTSLKELTRVLETSGARGRVVLVDKHQRRWVASSVIESLRARLLGRLEAFHAQSAERDGMPREEARQRLELSDERVFTRVVSSLAESKQIEVDDEVLRLPGRGRSFDDATRALRKHLLGLLGQAGLAPPGLDLLASRLGVDSARVTQMLNVMASQGEVVNAGEHSFDGRAVEALEARVREFFAREPKLSTAAFKELVGQSRKFAIPLAEYFDAKGLTLRVGDLRTLRAPREK